MEQDTPARPERRDLPVEVWLTIVQSLRGGLDSHFRLYPVRLFDKRTLKTLRRVSRALYDLTDPLYWEHVEISAMTRPEEALETVKHLKTNPARWNYVKYLVLQGWRADYEVPQTQNDVRAASEVLSELFTSLQNLQAVHFQNMHLTPSMVAHLYALPKLQSVALLHLLNIPPSARLDHGKLPILSLSLEKTVPPQSPDPSVSLSIPDWMELFVNPTTLEKLRVSVLGRYVIYRLPPEVSFNNLQRFEGPEPLASDDFDQFCAFVRRCPNLKCTYLYSTMPLVVDSIPPFNLIPTPPSDVLTQLQWFQGTLSLAARIVPTRPVEEVYVNCGWDEVTFGPALQLLSTSSRPIRVFHLKSLIWSPNHLSLIASNLPLLEELEISLAGHMFPRDREIEIELPIDQLRPLSRLRSFTLKNVMLHPNRGAVAPEPFPTMADGPSQVEVVRTLARSHPFLEYVKIGQAVRWYRERDGWVWRSLGECVAVNF